MRQLVEHYLRRANPKVALIVSSIMLLMMLGMWRLLPSGLGPVRFLPFVMFTMYGMIVPILTMEGEEFDLVLPVRRRTLYLARNLAALLLMILIAAPISAAALLGAAAQGDLWEALRLGATIVLCMIAMPVMAAPLVRFARRTRPMQALIIGAVPLGAIFVILMMALEGRISILLPAVVSVVGAALGWFLGGRQFERYELAPSRGSGYAQNGAARSTLTDHFSPMVRVLADALWLQWWYPPALVLVAFYSLMFTSTMTDVWLFYFAFAGCGGLILVLFSGIVQVLLPFVPRRTILRSVLGPIAAVPVLIGGIEAMAAGSAQTLVQGLATSLLTVGMTWLALPSAKEYGQPFLVGLRRNLSLLPILGFFVCAFVPVVKDCIGRALSMTWSHAAPWVDGKPVLVFGAMGLAIVLLWWRCERKFRHYEPVSTPRGLADAG